MTIELRDASPAYWGLSGLATTWSPPKTERGAYFVSGRDGVFLERVERGAFGDAVSGRDEVELRLEHRADGPVYASTTGRTLMFRDAGAGLAMGAALSKSDRATQTVVADIQAKRKTGLSVGMCVTADDWGKAADGRTELRTITSAALKEVSIVANPANPRALLAVRSGTGTSDVEYRSYPLAFRQEPALQPSVDQADGDDGGVVCPMGIKRSALTPNDTTSLRARLHRIDDLLQAEAERRFMADAWAARERAWRNQSGLVEQRELFGAYERMRRG